MSTLRSEPAMSDAQFRLLCDLVRAHCGLHFDDGTRYLVEKRVARRMQAVEAASLSSYLYALRRPTAGDDELTSLVDELTTNETYFFREQRQLRALIDEILPERLRARGVGRERQPVQIWSAGCSSGEEPYSIVMLAREAGFVPGRDLRVYASDIAPSVLTKARRGHYRPASFRETPDPLREKYFVEKDGVFRLRDEVRTSVDFIHLNLLDPAKIALLGAMDVILCRNVIIYFDAETKKRVIDTFYERLAPGGYLLLGHAESLITLSTAFELCHLRSDLVYRRPVPGEERDDPWNRIALATAAEADRAAERRR